MAGTGAGETASSASTRCSWAWSSVPAPPSDGSHQHLCLHPGQLVPSASPCAHVHIHIQAHACILNFLITQVEIAVCQVHMKSQLPLPSSPCSQLPGRHALTPYQKRMGLYSKAPRSSSELLALGTQHADGMPGNSRDLTCSWIY